MASRTFIDYPEAQEASDVSYAWKEDKNPPLRGLLIVVASSLVHNIGFVNKYLWENTGFGAPKNLPDLIGLPTTLRPRVIPTVPAGTPAANSGDADADADDNGNGKPGLFYSAADYHALYKSGAATPLDVVEVLLPLVQRGRQSPYELAFLATRADEVRAAAQASTTRWAAGQPLGPLDGVPFSVKCDIDVAGYVTTFGLDTRPGDSAFGKRYPGLRTPAKETSPPVRKLLEAGALLVAQNNMHEIGMDATGCNVGNGTPVNWYNTQYYPGGSSSGAGSALGAGLVPIAVGTDASGSIRVPPCFNGVYGLKTTHDRTVAMDSSTCITGPMAATVSDLTTAYRTMAQADAGDLVQRLFAPSVRPARSAAKTLGVCRAWVARAEPAVQRAFEQALAHLQKEGGYAVVEIGLPQLSAGQAAHTATCLSEGLVQARERAAPHPEQWAALLSPANTIVMSVVQHASAVDYVKYGQMRTLMMRHLAHLHAQHPHLLIVTPTVPMAGWPVHPGDAAHGFTDGNASLRSMLYAWLANMTGCPAVTCPMGYAEPAQGEGRLPMGIMAMGEWGAEEQLLGWAAEVEAYLRDVYPDGRLRPAQWVDVLARAQDKAEEAKGK